MPNLVDNIHVSGGQEDHVSMAMNTATRSMKVLEMVEDIIIFEIMMAVRGLNLVQHDELSLYLSNMLNFINEKIEFTVDDHVIRNVFVDYKELIVMEKYKEILNNFENYPKSFL
jgi:histidine ammonia-lyase